MTTLKSVLLCVLLLCPAALHAAPADSAALEALGRDYWDEQMRLWPLYATFVNDPRHHDRLDDIGASGRAEEARSAKALLARLGAIERSGLSESERISWDILKLQLENTLEAPTHKLWQWNVDHMDGPQSWIPTVVAMGQPMKNAEDAEALLLRLKAVPSYFAQQTSNLREGLAEGRVAARVPVEKTIAQLEGLLKTPAAQSPYMEAVKRLPEALRPSYGELVTRTVETHVYPAYRDYRRFLAEEYLPQSRATGIGLSNIPEGLKAYRYQIRYHTTVDRSPEELHQLGLSELKGIHAELRAIAKRMGHKGDLKSFLDKVRHDPANFFSTREQVLQDAQEIVSRVKAELPRSFGILPKTDLLVQPIEPYKEKNDVAARYYQPPDDLSRPGIYFINTYQPETRPRFSMTSLACHEGVPGHHLQIAIALEQRGLPTFRRNAGFNAYVEGWALYTERLCEELGMYPTDLSRVGMLSDQALRAARLAVDTGLHAQGWERQRAIDFMKDNTPMSEDEIVAEVDRYTVWPGQALSYKVGQREIMALRERSRKALGARFDIRRFHDTVLKNGAVPLTILRQTVADADGRILSSSGGPAKAR